MRAQAVHAGKLNSLLNAPEEGAEGYVYGANGAPIPITTFVLRREQGESWGMGLNARHEVGIRP